MVELAYVIAFAMAVLNLFKHKLTDTTTPLAAISIAVVINIVNALVFGGDTAIAAKEAFMGAGIFVGIFASGTYIRKAVIKDPTQVTTTVVKQDPETPNMITTVSKTETKSGSDAL
jgi:hypothetical protein